MTKNNDDEQVILEFGVQTFTLTDYTRYQEMVLMRIIKACQSDISDAITSYKNNNILVFSKEENSEQVRHRRLKLQLLEPNKTHYNKLKKAKMRQSMSRVAKCIDNGPMEGFWGILKRESYYGKRFTSREELVRMIENYIIYYNNRRVQRNLGVLTPMEKHNNYLLAA